MKKFLFPLQTVLEYKNQVLDGLQNEHAKAVKEMLAQEEKLDVLHQEYLAQNQQYNQQKSNGLTIIEALQYEAYLKKLEQKMKQAYDVLLECKKREEQKRNAVVEGKKETASMEMLKEKKLDQYNKYAQKQQELFVEEFVTYRKLANRS